jgi:predicted nucleic acid-binding protein
MIFLDTNVLVAATQITHPHNQRSRALLARTTGVEAVIAAHTLAELYSSLTSIRPPERVSPEVAMQALEAYLSRLTPITLTTDEYLRAIRDTAKKGHIGGMIHDALLLACARKSRADFIYTWNIKHFQAIAPDLADRIITP